MHNCKSAKMRAGKKEGIWDETLSNSEKCVNAKMRAGKKKGFWANQIPGSKNA
jgi:hypothetical protein